jgi:Superinfection immunity protein
MFLLFWCLLYFLPSIIGHRKRSFVGILMLNLFLGWTVIGWVVALVWACTADDDVRVVAIAGPPGRYCCGCGALSAAGAQFCWSCGRRV